MQQQLIEQTIEITPSTMTETLSKIIQLLNQHNLAAPVVDNIVKSLFYGLWNFDKMINQHALSTNIADMLNKVPKKNAFIFLQALLNYLTEKWNLIDHHRINKFMQLVRYLLRQAIKVSHKKTDELLMETVFANLQQRSGIADHVTQIYFEIICESNLIKNQQGAYTSVLPSQKLQIFQKLLQSSETLQYLRLHIIECVYQKYKQHIIDVEITKNQQQVLKKIDAFNEHILNLAKAQQHDIVRKNLYTLIGFMKSDHGLFSLYSLQKKQKVESEREKKKKKISKGKKQMIKQAKTKRKEKNKQKKKPHIMSRPKFEFKAREQLNKMID